ncbi:MAG: DUF2442 domain-containing protein [Thermoguttaceae bacterium]|jgi:hypothetical protein
MDGVPRVVRVEPVGQAKVLVRFENGVEKIYDCRPLLSRSEFGLLANAAFFRAVRVDPGGYGISWSDNVDVSEYELWTRGMPATEEPSQSQGRGSDDQCCR